MRFSVASLVAFVGAASAAAGCSQAPVGDTPSGNPIAAPGLSQIVPAGTPFTITWNPTSPGSVSIVLLRGPSTNVVPLQCLGDNIPNTGKFVWTPSTSLEPDTSRYGLQIIVTGTGQYQYSTQFGVSNPVGQMSSKGATVSQITDGQIQAPVSTSASASASVPAPASVSASVFTSASSTASNTSTPSTVKIPTIAPSIVPINSANSTKPISVPAPTSILPTQAPYPISTGLLPNSSIIQPTGSLTVPSTLQSTVAAATTGSSSTARAPAQATGAAAKTAVAGVLAGLGMVVALVL